MRLLIAIAVLASQAGWASLPSGPTVLTMPMTCSELLPDASLFIAYYQAIAQGTAKKDRAMSKRIFRLIALRNRLNNSLERIKEINPVDILLRKTICFYRETKDPLRVVPFDDPDFLRFLSASLKELETKVDDAIFQWEYERNQRRKYEFQLKANESLSESLRREAEQEAAQNFNRLSLAAKKKATTP